MRDKSIKDMSVEEILRQQLEVLAERSKSCLDEELPALTTSMINIISILLQK